jgi:hypothetical protein
MNRSALFGRALLLFSLPPGSQAHRPPPQRDCFIVFSNVQRDPFLSPPSRFASSPTSLTEERGLGLATCRCRDFNRVLQRNDLWRRVVLVLRLASVEVSVKCQIGTTLLKSGHWQTARPRPLPSLGEGELANREGGIKREGREARLVWPFSEVEK